MALPRLGCIVQGGSTASLDAQTNFDQYSMAIFSAFKFNGTKAWANSLRSTYPGLTKILMYQAAADINPTGIECGVTKSDADAHDAGVGGGSTGDYWLLRQGASPYPSGSFAAAYAAGAPGNYFGNINSTTFRSKWVSNVLARASAAGVDGIFIDNCLGYLNGSAPVAPETGTTYTDATWATAMVAFMSAVVPQLQAAGLYVLPNTYDGSARVPGDVVWWDRIAQTGTDGMMNENWLQNGAGGTTARVDSNADNARFSAWMSQPLAAVGRGKDSHVEVSSPSTDTSMRTYHYGAFYLIWDGSTSGRSTCWVTGSDASNMGTWAATMVDPGIPGERAQEVDGAGTAQAALATSLYRRRYSRGIVFVNAHPTTTYTISSYGDSRIYRDNTGAVVATGWTIAPGTARVLTADTDFVAVADPAAWTKVSWAIASPAVGTVSKHGITLNNAVAINDLIVVATSRSFGSNDLASETVTDNLGNTYTQIPSTNYDSSDVQSMVLYYSIVTQPGIPAIIGNWPNASNFSIMCAAAFRKAGFKGSLDVSVTTTGVPQRGTVAGAGTDTVTLSLTTTTAGSLVVGVFGNVSSAATLSSGTGYTTSTKDLLLGNLLEHQVQSLAGAINVTESPSGAMNYVGVAAAFKSTAVVAALSPARAVSNSYYYYS